VGPDFATLRVVPGTKLVVYIEDNPSNFALARKILEWSGNYQVINAKDGIIGLQMVRERRPDVILLDLDLPGISGIEVVQTIRRTPEIARIPVLAVTASVMKRERTQAMEAGCDRFIEKPFDIHDLKRQVDEVAGLA
jgi:two-component system cell cycle response regulator DivK